jgi:NAD(P)-dependent dehydrogenase (short-subunit alcohol dehydrogenase family)
MTQQILKDKVALITGGTTGIGLATAQLFLEHGAKVVLAGRRSEEGAKAVTKLRANVANADVTFVQTDVSQKKDVQHLIQATVEQYGKLDIAFNNAGIEGKFGPVQEIEEADYDLLMGINTKGVWLSCKYEIEQFKKQGRGGAIVNTSSWLAVGAFSGSAVYSASKAALDGMARALAVEVAGDHIRINNVQPGYIETPMFSRFFSDEASKLSIVNQAPLGRFGTAADVAELVLWLSSASSTFVTGASILVDGGLAIAGQRR